MTTFYIAIKSGSGFDTKAEAHFDTADNDKSIEDQWTSGIFQKTSTSLSDGRTLFKIEGENVASSYTDFLDIHYDKPKWRTAPGARRHYQTASMFLAHEDGGLFLHANVTEERLQTYMELFDYYGGRSAFKEKWFKADAIPDAAGVIGTVNVFLKKNDTESQAWLRKFVMGLEAKMVSENLAADATEEQKLAFVYNLLGDEGMNFYRRALEILGEVKIKNRSFLETGTSKWHVTEGLIRRDGTYSWEQASNGGYGINVDDAPIPHALDDWYEDEATAYFEFGGANRSISRQELAIAEQNAGSDVREVQELSRTLEQMRRTIGMGHLGSFEVYADLGCLQCKDVGWLLWTDRQGSLCYNFHVLANADTRNKLLHLLYQLEHNKTFMDTDFKQRTVAMVKNCLQMADALRTNPASVLTSGYKTIDGKILRTWQDDEEQLCVLSERGWMNELYQVTFSHFDRYIRQLQGEAQIGEDEDAPKIAQCDDGAFTGAIDTTWDDECERYYGLMGESNVSLQQLDELYSYSHGAAGVKQVIDHFTREALVFTLAERQTNRSWAMNTVTIDPDTGMVLLDGEELTAETLDDSSVNKLQIFITQLRLSGDSYTRYVDLLQAKIDLFVATN